jgi:PAS domain-containing protein
VELVAVHRDGHEFPIEVSLSTVSMSGKWCAVGFLRDIAERKKVEKALTVSERFARSTLDALSTHIAILDERGLIVATNKAWQEFAIANAAKTEVGIGANYLDACDRADGPCGEEAAAVAAGIRAVILGKQGNFALEYPCHSPSEKRWFLARATQFGGDGPVRVVMSHENITATKLADEERQKFVSLVENSIDFIGMATLSGTVLYTNPAACELVGLDSTLRGTATRITDFYTESGKRVLDDITLPTLRATGRWEGEIYSWFDTRKVASHSAWPPSRATSRKGSGRRRNCARRQRSLRPRRSPVSTDSW